MRRDCESRLHSRGASGRPWRAQLPVAGEIQDDGAVLARRGAQGAADHLQIEREASGRTQKDRGADRRNVDAFRNQTAVRDDLDLAAREARNRAPALAGGRFTFQVDGGRPGIEEGLGDRPGMRDVDAKGDGRNVRT
jgi:hypothetical protein